MAGYGGNVLQLTLGDKGAYLYGVFGSPVAHEDDAARAATAALELRDLERTTAARDIQIGIDPRAPAQRHVRPRDAAHVRLPRRRRESLGPTDVGGAAGTHLRAEDGPPGGGRRLHLGVAPDLLRVKGKTASRSSRYALTATLERTSRRKTRYELPLVGRAPELRRLDDALEATLAGARADRRDRRRGRDGQVTARRGVRPLRPPARAVRGLRRVPVVRDQHELLRLARGLAAAAATRGRRARRPAARRGRAAARRASTPTLVARAPLLLRSSALDIPDNALTRAFDAKLRKASLEDLLSVVLRARSAAEPIVLVLEDCHWIDALSRDLLERAGSRRPRRYRVLVVLAYRPAAERRWRSRTRADRRVRRDRARRAGRRRDAAAHPLPSCEQVLGATDDVQVGDELVELVTDALAGQPVLHRRSCSTTSPRRASTHATRRPSARSSCRTACTASSSSRIDTLADGPRRTLKVASVVGRRLRGADPARRLPRARRPGRSSLDHLDDTARSSIS